VFEYCLAAAAKRTGVQIHAVCALSDHYHAVATDPEGRLPEFYGWLHEFVGRALNASYGRSENLWAGSTATNVVRLCTPDTVLDKVAYTLVNPVDAGLVSHHTQWPGVLRYRPGHTTIKRPAVFFSDTGTMPAEATLELVAAPIGVADADVVDVIDRCANAREVRLRAAAHDQRRRFLGRAAVLATRVTDRPRMRELRRTLTPRIACKDTQTRIAALERLKKFVIAYRDAWHSWCKGDHTAEFPAGTYLMARRFGVAIAET